MKRFFTFIFALLLLMTAFAGSALAAEEYRYATEPVNMRTGPSTKYKIITELKTGEQVEYIGKSGNWSKVVWNGQTGYVFTKYLDVVPEPYADYLYATEPVNLRTGPGTKYKIIAELQAGEEVEQIGSRSGNWSNVLWKGQRGFVFSKYLTEQKPAQAPDQLTLARQFHESGYRQAHRDIVLGVFSGDGDTFHVRVTRDANVEEVTRDLEDIFDNPLARFKVVRSSLPSYVNIVYLENLWDTIDRRYQALSKEEQQKIQLSSGHYFAEQDQFIMQIVKLDSAKERNFKRYLSDWKYITFKNIDGEAAPVQTIP